MEITQTLYVNNRKDWRNWLRQHYLTEKEIWLVYPHKDTGQPRIPYNDAVEEALCFGWIDSTVKNFDENNYAQRFSPRNSKSRYSQSNIERLRRLLEQRKVVKSVRLTLGGLFNEKFEIQDDILRTIQANPQAWKNFQKFGETYQRIRIAYIEGARHRPNEFKKRLAYFMKKTEENRQIGFGGIQKYY